MGARAGALPRAGVAGEGARSSAISVSFWPLAEPGGVPRLARDLRGKEGSRLGVGDRLSFLLRERRKSSADFLLAPLARQAPGPGAKGKGVCVKVETLNKCC